ncbi:hypothetical protein BKA69DRAFT_1125803 [Paraphysoderma sedebokerense]|nr:hypothetical protein BKA69DRAFT_1125803 [Paraphysoderma sedebokerense]
MSRTMLQNLDGKGAPKRKNYGKLDRYAHLVFRYLFTRAVYERNSSNESSSATNSSNASQLFLNSAVNPEEFTMAKVNNSALLRIYAAAFLGEIMLALIPILATISDIQYCNIYTMYIPLYVLLIPAPLFSILLLFVMRDIQDNFHIKFGLAFSFGCILCSQVFYFIAEYPIWIYGYTHIRGVTFLLIAILLVYTVDTVVPVYRAYLQTKTSASVRKDDQDNLTLDQVIDHPVYWVQFQQQIVRDYAGENSQFINDYKRIVAKLKPIESQLSSTAAAKADTKNNVLDQSSPFSAPAIPANQGANSTHIHTMIQEIIRNYISPGAPFELNISGKARSSLMGEDKNRKAEGTLLTLQLLEPILKEVKKNLETNSWPRFRATLKNGGNKSPP